VENNIRFVESYSDVIDGWLVDNTVKGKKKQ
jgi:hypothetical protein